MQFLPVTDTDGHSTGHLTVIPELWSLKVLQNLTRKMNLHRMGVISCSPSLSCLLPLIRKPACRLFLWTSPVLSSKIIRGSIFCHVDSDYLQSLSICLTLVLGPRLSLEALPYCFIPFILSMALIKKKNSWAPSNSSQCLLRLLQSLPKT